MNRYRAIIAPLINVADLTTRTNDIKLLVELVQMVSEKLNKYGFGLNLVPINTLMDSKIKIEKNIPFMGNGKRGPDLKYPFDQMNAGDSFFIELKKGQMHLSLQSSIHSAARRWAFRNMVESKWATKREGNGIRIWRIK